MRVFGWAADSAGCGWYRLRQPLGELERQGYAQVKVDEIWDDMFCRSADVIVGQRVSKEGASKRWQYMASLPFNQRPLLVFEVDDDLWHVSPDNEIASDYYNNPVIRKRLTANLQVADLVTVTTEQLAETVSEVASVPVAVLPNYIPRALLDRPLGAVTRMSQVIVGWAGSATHRGDFEMIEHPLRQAKRRVPFDRLAYHAMGTNYFPADLQRGSFKFTPWQDSVSTYYDLVDFNVGLAPLKPGMFNRNKSAIKALEYAAMGIPVIASDAGPYPSFVENGQNGLLIRADFGWSHAIVRLVNNDEERVHMGQIARKDARHYTIEEHASKWLDAYEKGIRNALQQRGR